MHFKSFTLGMGVGIIFISIIFLVAITIFFNSPAATGSQADIIQQNEPEYQSAPELSEPTIAPEPDNYIPEYDNSTQYYEDYQALEIGEYLEPQQAVAREEVNIQIAYGMPAIFISQLLFEQNIINDTESFTQYLIASGFSTRLRAGFLTFKTYSSFEEALSVLIARDIFPHEVPF